MNSTWEQDFHIRYREIAENGGLKMSAWFDFMQESAANHADKLGFGYESLKSSGLIWVLSGMHIRIYSHPGHDQTVHVLTYPSGIQRLFATRQFMICGSDGKLLAEAGSSWLVLDSKTYRPKKIEVLGIPMPDNPDLPRYFIPVSRIPATDKTADRMRVGIRYSMEDLNGHLNNAEYADIASDFLAAGTEKKQGISRISEMEIYFLNSVHRGETLRLNGINDFPGHFFIQGINESGKAAFTASIATADTK